MPIAPIPPRKRKGKALSAADIAMQQAQQEERPQQPAPRRQPVIRPTNRWSPVDAGDDGIVCRNCGGGLREHIGGWCQQGEGEQAQEPIQAEAQEPQPGEAHEVEDGPEVQQQIHELRGDEFTPRQIEMSNPEGILETAVRLAEMLPPCDERDILLCRCAALMSAVISNLFVR